MVKLDAYNLRARLFPAVLGVAPAIALATVAVSWDDLGLPQAIATLAVGVLFVAAADLARRLGRWKERKIFAYNNGQPDLPLNFHPIGSRALFIVTPFSAGGATDRCA